MDRPPRLIAGSTLGISASDTVGGPKSSHGLERHSGSIILSAGLIYADEAMAEPDLGKGTTHENRRRVPLRLHQGRRRSGPREDHGLPLHGLPSWHRLRLPR